MQTAAVTMGGTVWQVDVAETASERTQGLSNVPVMSAYTGMLFDMGSQGSFSIQTLEMLFWLDVLYFDDNFVVTEIKGEVIPGLDGIVNSIPARYFLEVNAGESVDVSVGDVAIVTGYTPTIDSTSIISTMVTMMIVVMMMGMMMRTMKDV